MVRRAYREKEVTLLHLIKAFWTYSLINALARRRLVMKERLGVKDRMGRKGMLAPMAITVKMESKVREALPAMMLSRGKTEVKV